VWGVVNVVWKAKIMGRSIANLQLQNFSDFIWKSHKKAGPLNFVFRHGISNLGTCKLLWTCVCNMQLLTDRTMVRSVLLYTADTDRELLARVLSAYSLGLLATVAPASSSVLP